LIAANRAGIFGTIFASTRAQRDRLREVLSLVFTALAEGGEGPA